MPKLSDLVDVNINKRVMRIQNQEIPVQFDFNSIPYVEEAYGEEYEVFKKEINEMLTKKEEEKAFLSKNETKLMNALIYAMVRTGGTECTVQEIASAIPLRDLKSTFQVAIDLLIEEDYDGAGE